MKIIHMEPGTDPTTLKYVRERPTIRGCLTYVFGLIAALAIGYVGIISYHAPTTKTPTQTAGASVAAISTDTFTPQPTSTIYNTASPQPTQTPLPTATATPTSSATQSNTPTKTPTIKPTNKPKVRSVKPSGAGIPPNFTPVLSGSVSNSGAGGTVWQPPQGPGQSGGMQPRYPTSYPTQTEVIHK